ncbi:MAG: Crp/Fnr family transcriptional regulator [Thermodesulfovibrionia bacterium]
MTPTIEIINDLRRIPCLSGLCMEDISIIEQMAEIKEVSRNEILFIESDPVRFFFIVHKGSIKLFKSSIEGREIVIRTMGAGDYFCCAPIFGNKCQSVVSAIAQEDSTLIAIPSDSFKEMLFGNMSEFGKRIIMGLCGRVKYLSNLVEDLTFRDVEQRVIMSLLRIAEEKSVDEDIVHLTLTHQDIASMTGTVREVVSRTMSRLKKEGVIVESSIRGFKIDKGKLNDLISKRYQLKYC